MFAEPDAKACILAHRDELTAQNRAKFARVNPGFTHLGVRCQREILGRPGHLRHGADAVRPPISTRWPTLDLLVIDEAHHARRPPTGRHRHGAEPKSRRLAIFGVTATPNRGDGKGCARCFSNVADQISLGELIAAGHLVPPRTFVIDVGVQDALRRCDALRGLRHGRGRVHPGQVADHRRGHPALEGKGVDRARPSSSARPWPMPRTSAMRFSPPACPRC